MLSKNLKNIREKKRYSKLRLARETGLSARCIENIEHEKAKSPRIETLKKIAKVLDVSLEKLLE